MSPPIDLVAIKTDIDELRMAIYLRNVIPWSANRTVAVVSQLVAEVERLQAVVADQPPILWWVRDTSEEGATCVEAPNEEAAWLAALPHLGIEPDSEDATFNSFEYAIDRVTEADIDDFQKEIGDAWNEFAKAGKIQGLDTLAEEVESELQWSARLESEMGAARKTGSALRAILEAAGLTPPETT